MCSMVDGNTTTIEVTKATWQRLNSEKRQPGESFDDTINYILDTWEGGDESQT